jgi:drug/metabolite transporter (DMT)-like permease
MGEPLAGNALFGLLAAGLWGIGDFSGGMGVKTAGGSVGAALRVVLFSHLTSFSVLLVVAFARGDAFPHGALLAWGITAGAVAGISLVAFYIALSRGAMGVSAAISGVLAAAIPAVVDTFAEGTPDARHLVGFLVAAAAIWLIAAGNATEENSSPRWLAIAAGAGFGFYFVALKFAGAGGLVWPMATCRIGSISVCVLVLLLMRGAESVQITPQGMQWVLLTALFDTTGNISFIAATRAGRLDIAAVLASLYPASTILLAAWRNKERPTRRQGWGMVVAVVAVLLISG